MGTTEASSSVRTEGGMRICHKEDKATQCRDKLLKSFIQALKSSRAQELISI